MDDLIKRKKVLDTIFEWITSEEINHPDAIRLLGERIRNIPPENVEPE